MEFQIKYHKSWITKRRVKKAFKWNDWRSRRRKKIGTAVILDIIEKCISFKLGGDDTGHYVKNIGFDEKILPEEIKSKYIEHKKKNHYIIKNCDILSAILSVNKINGSSDNYDETEKK